MNDLTFNYQSSRARKARLSIVLDKKWLRRLLGVLALVTTAAWILLALV